MSEVSMIDKVTYAIMNAFFSRPVGEQLFNASPVDNEDLARAAIAAMREPTEEMKFAPPDVQFGPTDAEFVWHCMIDAALK